MTQLITALFPIFHVEIWQNRANADWYSSFALNVLSNFVYIYGRNCRQWVLFSAIYTRLAGFVDVDSVSTLGSYRYIWPYMVSVFSLTISTLVASLEAYVCKQCRSRWAGSYLRKQNHPLFESTVLNLIIMANRFVWMGEWEIICQIFRGKGVKLQTLAIKTKSIRT